MLDTSSWPRDTLRVHDQLHLDPKNIRLETANAQVEADIIEDLFDNENALELVDAIAKIGYLTHEVPIAVKRRGKHTVVEGNRRLAALKAIQNPKIVPNYQARVSALAKTMGQARDRLERIEVMVAPNQAQADQLIAALHTSNPRKPWSPARQAAFFQAQIDAGRTFAQLVERYPTINVPRFVFRAHLINRFRSAVAKEPELADFIESRDWKSGFSALTRIFESKEFQAITGACLDSNGKLATSLSASDFDLVATLIIQGMQDRSINTRTLNKVSSPRFLKLMAEIRTALDRQTGRPHDSSEEQTRSTQQKDGTPGESSSGTSDGKNGHGSNGSKKSTRRKNKTTVLPIGHVSVPDEYGEPLKSHFQELSIINIQRTPNAAYLVLRAILEKTIKAYADQRNVDIGKTKHNSKGRVQLHNCLTWAIEYWGENGPTDLVDPAKRIQGGRLSDFTSTRTALNALNHNYKFHVDPDEVERAWQSIDPLMRELLKP